LLWLPHKRPAHTAKARAENERGTESRLYYNT
jgi:hypothetical protein